MPERLGRERGLVRLISRRRLAKGSDEGWAKAHLRRAHHLSIQTTVVGTLALCPPY